MDKENMLNYVCLFIYFLMSLCIRLFCAYLTQHFFVCRINPVLVLSISDDLKLISLSQRQNLLLSAFLLLCELFQMERDVYSLEFAVNDNAVISFS
jgi:hypothetical protein